MILDGFGHREATEHNAIAQANCPHWRRMWQQYPHTLIHTSGKHVGLPEGQMGNSEVGHMNLGSGRVVYQDFTRIEKAIEDGDLGNIEALTQAFADLKTSGQTLHLMGLLSPGGVHSHERHLFSLLELAIEAKLPRIAIHAFLDGRDMPPRSAEPSLDKLQALVNRHPSMQLASLCGRYHAMDRDNNFDRIHSAWRAIVDAEATHHTDDALQALQQAYARDENDEFVAPTVIGDGVPVVDGDAVLCFNFRADRVRQISQAFVTADFDGFAAKHRPALSHYLGMTQYSSDLPMSVLFPPDDLPDTLGETLAKHGKTQLRIAETEKYAHITFFFNGGREQPFDGESRTLIPSPKVATYDLQPEMSCPQVTDALVEAIEQQTYDVIVCNLANPDMVGHTGKLSAAIQAVEAIDVALGRLEAAINQVNGSMLVTADHGNLELMFNSTTGQPHTSHTTGPVPFVLCQNEHAHITLDADGSLCDVAPTMLALLGLPQPKAMLGRSLINKSS